MKKNIIIVLLVLLVIFCWLSAVHFMNMWKMMKWNSMHNMIMWDMKTGWHSMWHHDMWNHDIWNHDMWDGHSKNHWEVFDENTDWLPEAKKSELVVLKNWDTYEMSAYAVKQEVWNRTVKRLSYNGMIPWPLLQVEKWAKINLKFTNNLWIETTLHSHWLRLENSKFDGLPLEMWGEQKAMEDGESFTYELDFPDTGVYWYHPHIREDYTQEMGLYGNFNVTENAYWNKIDREEFLILDDFSEDDVFYKNKINKTLMWRFWNIMMINNEEDYKLNLQTGESTRLFITNVANTRTFDFKIVNSNWEVQNLKLVWWDIWRIEKEENISNQIIAPAERYIVETVFNEQGTYIIKSKNRKLWEIVVTWEKKNIILWELRGNSDDYKNIRNNLDKYLKQDIDKKITLTIWMKGMKWKIWGMMNMWGMNHGWEHDVTEWIEWEDEMAMMNNMSNNQMMEWKVVDEGTGKENMEINWEFKKWDFVKVEIYNDPESMHPMQHPVHFHWQRFVVLSRDWVINNNLQWKDTTLVQNGEKIEILVEMTNVWTWMSHCHIAEHLQSGMMLVFRVEK